MISLKVWVKAGATYVYVGDELDGLSVLAKFLRLDVLEDGHAMAADQASVESVRRKATRSETLRLLVLAWRRVRIVHVLLH